MTTVIVEPLPLWARQLPRRLRPVHPPIFDGEPTPTDAALALALIDELDDESRRWYGEALVARLRAMLG